MTLAWRERERETTKTLSFTKPGEDFFSLLGYNSK
jgi:hypothetical protein